MTEPRVILHGERGSVCVDAFDGRLFFTAASSTDEIQVPVSAEDEDRLRQLLVERANQAGER